ncbi:protein translocase subunit SecD [Longibacter salinarum]|uniref:Protein translocase subunit SecD n=2 Tax=Longibacter salinarum TaxID=1850348 RepID=A0A2A8CYY3_9BACT|nr:protein translocase subunit SecD [Longibacter salinarum]
MKGNGFKVFTTIAFLGLCLWSLFPSFQSFYYSQKMSDMTAEEQAAYMDENRQNIQQARSESLKLGLDLLGGMHVTLEVQTGQLIGQLATNRDSTFDAALKEAIDRSEAAETPVVTAFVQEMEERDPNIRLSRYFRDEDDGITRRSENDQVVSWLRDQADEAVTRGMEIVRNRVDRYGVTEPSIQRKDDRQIVVELPGIDDPDRIRELLKGTAQLEFRLMAEPARLQQVAQRLIQYYEPSDSALAAAQTSTVDTAAAADGASEEGTALTDGTQLTEADTSEQGTSLTGPDTGSDAAGPSNPLVEAVQQFLPQGRPVTIAWATAQDTSTINSLMADPGAARIIPGDIELLWSAAPVASTQNGQEIYSLLGVKRQAELTGDVVVDASVEFSQQTNEPSVSMTMNAEGARIWSRITGANVGKQVSIVLDRYVVSWPNINEKIAGGRTSITGLESRQEAQDIVTVLKSGALPAPVDIVEERTVGPSLGEASIRAGFISVVVGLLLVALFMIMYYRTAGIVADVALLLNVILIFGVLAGFNATLTLPGIAGIVLTIGMAVDANVLIFDRIREEQNAGKTLRASVSSGYEKALSAILDANITTFFVGVILYSFGVGPIQGFAVTLMAGILSSLFTAIVVTRLIFDYMILERQMKVSYG